MYPNKILAVVVTYNRLELLKRCIRGLQAQTLKDFDILIVNNGSTDGTKEWISSLPEDILRIHQGNLGGAGGFYAGQKYGYDNGYEWIWMMDDDGVPDSCQLENLLSAAIKYELRIVAPLVLNIDKPGEEAFYPGSKLILPDSEVSDKTRFVCPFNGIMFNRGLVSKIGFIKKELFIWGDEREYTLRWRKAGYKEYAVLNAIHYHPQIKTLYGYALPFSKKYRVALKNKALSKYFYRNNGYINRKYFSMRVTIAEGLLYSIYFLRKMEFKELCKYVKYYFKGTLKND